MQFNNVGEIFAALDKARDAFKKTVSGLSVEQSNLRENGQGWTIAEIAEHVGIVLSGISLITGKFLPRAESESIKFDGNFSPPISFAEHIRSLQDSKLEAPERVHPQGRQTVSESLTKMDESLASLVKLRPRLEAADASNVKFPHPFLGDLNLYEWLILAGLHEWRHLRQIERILAENV